MPSHCVTLGYVRSALRIHRKVPFPPGRLKGPSRMANHAVAVKILVLARIKLIRMAAKLSKRGDLVDSITNSFLDLIVRGPLEQRSQFVCFINID